VFFSNQDIDIVRGAAEKRRKFLDFAAVQVDPIYRAQLRAYERALRSRNMLLKSPQPKWREIAAFNRPLAEAGTYLRVARKRLISTLAETGNEAQRLISGATEKLEMNYVPGFEGELEAALEAARSEDLRLRQTNAGPHRDDVAFLLNGHGQEFASEGQQRSLALALRLAQARLIEAHSGSAPLFLMDDIFGELDPRRRNALLAQLPPHAQKLITTTHIDWMQTGYAQQIMRLSEGQLAPFQ